MKRRTFIERAAALGTVGAAGVGTASAASAASDDEDDGCQANPEDGDHPVESAVTFGWYGGGGRVSVPAGPLAVVDMSCAGGRFDVFFHAREYAEYVYDSDPVWREYSSIEAIEDNVKWHLIDPDGSVGIVLWERVWNQNVQPPEGFYDEYGPEDF